MEAVTTIKLGTQTKSALDQFREYKNESYDEVVSKLIHIVKNIDDEPPLSKQTIKEIERARAEIRAGNYYTEEEMAKRLGLK
jgi:predicted transcriptional regulator